MKEKEIKIELVRGNPGDRYMVTQISGSLTVFGKDYQRKSTELRVGDAIGEPVARSLFENRYYKVTVKAARR